VHENAAYLPDIVVDAPDPAPMLLKLGFVLERRGGRRRKHLDRLGIYPMGIAIVQLALSGVRLVGEMAPRLAPAGKVLVNELTVAGRPKLGKCPP
jgi:hypothetical protein